MDDLSAYFMNIGYFLYPTQSKIKSKFCIPGMVVSKEVVDINGQYRHVTIPAKQFSEDTLENGIGFDASNYGYAVVRSAIARKLVATGFHPTFGIHHDNQLNAFNLADDLIEPYRAIVDLVAHNNIASNIQLTKSERRELAHALHNACIVDGVKVNVMSAIDIMVESLKRIILDASTEKLKLPMLLPVESMEGITE